MKIPEKLSYSIAKVKIYIGRAFGYVTILNSVMIFSIFLSTLETRFSFKFAILQYLGAYVALVVVVMLIGYVDAECGIFEAENRIVTDKNPQIMEIYHSRGKEE